MSTSHASLQRSGMRGGFSQNLCDGCTAVGDSGSPRQSRTGDLSNGVFVGKTDGKPESLSRTNRSGRVFSVLSSQNPEGASETSTSGSGRTLPYEPGMESFPTDVPESVHPRERFVRKPPTVEIPSASGPESCSEEESYFSPVEIMMTEAEIIERIDEDSKEFFTLRNLDKAERFFLFVPSQYHFRFVNKLVSSVIDSNSKETDAQLVADFFARATSKNLCSASAFEDGFAALIKLIGLMAQTCGFIRHMTSDEGRTVRV